MNLLVVGGTGLISTAITRQAVAAGHDVTVFTRGETDAEIPDAVTRLQGDRTDSAAVRRARDTAAPDCVVDMVAYEPEHVTEAIGAFAGHVSQYILCSTVDVYHRPVETMPVRESAPREPAVSEYGADKAACEDLLFEAYRSDGFPATIIRPWHTYGEGGTLHGSLASPAYVDRLRKGKPILVHGDGSTVWGTCHRDDVAAAFVAAVGNHETIGEAYHVPSTEPMTWDQYHERAAAALDAPTPDLVHVPTDVLTATLPAERTHGLCNHYQFSTVFDASKARRDLGFRQTVPWEAGVRRTVDWLDDHGEIAAWDSDETYNQFVTAWREHEEEFIEAW